MFHLKTLLLLSLLLVTSVGAQCVITADGFGEREYTLYAGQNLDAGTVSIQITGENLVVTYQTTGLWKLESAALWVGSTSTGYPQNKSENPVPGKFPYKSGKLTNATSFQFMVPLALLGYQCPGEDASYYFMAHADLSRTNYDGSVQKETGWSDGNRVVEKGNWATLSAFDLTCDCDDGGGGGEKICETAFAFDPEKGNCFLDDENNKFNRWGWTNGPYNLYAGSPAETLYFYAGAAQCDLSKGMLAGMVTFAYGANGMTVIYDTHPTDWVIRETHTYLGSALYPEINGKPTVAPGQYPYIHENLPDVTRDTVKFDLIPYGQYYFIGHGVVCR